MRFSTLALSILILAAPATGVFAQEGGSAHGFLTPEQREMYMAQQRNGTDWHSLTRDQRRSQMESVRAKFGGMSEADKVKLKADMQAKFDALTPAEKQAVEERIARRDARRAQRMQNKGDDQQ